MMTSTPSIRYTPATRPLRTVALVSTDPDQRVLETVLGAVDHDVVLVESTDRAYSQIKRVMPDLVILCLGSDDREGCQLLTMLTVDRETSRIPVLTYVVPKSEHLMVQCPEGTFNGSAGVSPN